MTSRLVFADSETARDVLTFLGRARRASDGGVRFQASRGVMVISAAALAPQTLFDQTPTVLALRIVRADAELQCDIVVDELAETEDPRALALPETGLSPSWAGISPPQGGWEAIGELAAAVVARRAQWGISAVARGMTPGAGEEAVRMLRGSIWGVADDDLEGLPRGVAFAADAFGFISGEEQARVTRSGRWTRVSFARGHVLSRGPAVTGMTAIRETGPAH